MKSISLSLSSGTVSFIISGIMTILSLTWALSKDITIANLQKKNERDSLRIVAKNSETLSIAFLSFQDTVLSKLDKLSKNQDYQNQNQNQKADAIITTLKVHIEETAKDKKEIISMTNSLGPYFKQAMRWNITGVQRDSI